MVGSTFVSTVARQVIVALGLVVIGASVLAAPGRNAPPAGAHNVTLLPVAAGSIYVLGGQSSYVQPFGQTGPSDKDWTIDARITLSGGDNLQTAWFDYQVYDADLHYCCLAAEFGVPARDWGSGRTYGSTMTTHAGSLMYMQLWIHNIDPNGQWFDWRVRAGYQ